MKNKNNVNLNIEGNLKDVALNYIRELILEGNKLKQGERINERDIARDLNISRTPVREALNELKDKGLVDSVKYRGWFVPEVDKSLFEEIIELRTILQYNILKQVIKRGGPESFEIENLKKLNDQMKKIIKNQELKVKNNYEFWKKEMEFHSYICNLTKNNYKLTQKIHKDLSFQIFSTLQKFLNENSKLKKSVVCHDKLIDALANKDLERVEKVMFNESDNVRYY